MTTFPVSTSTLAAEALAGLISAKYLIEEVTCHLFRTGINHTYFVSTNSEQFVFRVYSHHWRTKNEILEEIKLLNLLKESGVSVSYPIPDSTSQFIQEIQAPEGLRYAVLFSFAEGGKVRFMNENTCFSIGKLMASIHQSTQIIELERINYNQETLLDLPYSYATQHFSEDLPEMEFLKRKKNEFAQVLNQAEAKQMQQGIVHLDIWYDNMAVTEDGEITIFDFDFCGNGWQLLDIAYFAKQLFHIEADKEAYTAKLEHFLDGYQSVSVLSEDELALMPFAGVSVWLFYLGVQSRRFDWSNIFLTENYLKMYVGRMKSWLEHWKVA